MRPTEPGCHLTARLFHKVQSTMKHQLFFFILLLASYACDENSAKNSANHKTQTNGESVEAENITDSLSFYNDLIKENPSNVVHYVKKAMYLKNRRNYQDALYALQTALKIDSANADLYAHQADLHYKMKNINESMAAAEQALEIDENHISANKRVAWVYFLLKDYENTFKYINIALAQNERDAECYFLKGMAYKEQEKLKLSVSSFRTAVEQDNDYYDAWIQLGLLHSLAEHEHTAFYYDNAIRVDSTKYEAHYNKAFFLQETEGNYREALKSYDAILRHNPNFYNAYFNKGYIYLEYLNEYDSAQMMFSRVVEINPAGYKAYLNRGLAYERQGDLQRAIEDINVALKMKPDYDLAAEAKTRVSGKM